MKTIEKNPSELSPNPWNSNSLSPENEHKLDASLKRLGIFKPVICRELENGALEILGGEHRAQAAVRIGLPVIPVVNLGKLDDKKAKEISLADNARYGFDDTAELAKILKDLEDDLPEFLPYTETDINSIFSASDINLDELELPEDFENNSEEKPEPRIEKAPKTHTIMRFKVPIGDAEKLTEMITRTQKREGFTTSDELTNAGDALVHIVLSGEGE